MIKKAILSILAIFSFAIIYAQDNVWIKGVVTDNKMQPIYGASVYVKGTLFGIRTDIKGEYELPIPKYYLPCGCI
ncbi:MAG: carboxypeptidase-like regulatory domain-containing protein [Bacteroidetes bacterium]|nr:carboxypeptidase-like regulatory domain-containing protein [Bacteroidota bacterium]